MAFDHYLPASYLGAFSRDTDPVRRKRQLWAVDKREGRLFQAPASNLCGAQNFYNLSRHSDQDPRFVDGSWSGYENNLNQAIDQMISGELEALQWLKTLVVFAAALLVRGEDFNSRFAERLGPDLTASRGRDNTNMMRLMELQRLFASMIGARWLLLETSGKVAQITNDLGYTPFLNPKLRESGIAVPVGPKHILLIIATLKRVIAQVRNGSWIPNIEHGRLEDDAHHAFLMNIAACAQRFVIGPDEATMRPYLTSEPNPPPVPEPAMLGFLNGPMARRYEMIYFQILTKLASPPGESDTNLYVDYVKNMTHD